jgi:heme o synthase
VRSSLRSSWESAGADPDRVNTPRGVRFAAARHRRDWTAPREWLGARPGPFFRLTALCAAVAIGVVVIDAAFELGHTHWGAALVALPLVAAVLLAAHIAYPWLVAPAAAAVGLLLTAIATGGIVAWSGGARWAEALHVGAAGAALAASIVTCALSLRGERVPFGPWRDYVTLTKPTIMALLLTTGAAGMFVGAGGWPGGPELAVMLLGLALACGGASALNHVMDADIDRLMGERTARRPVASGRVPVPRALEYGLALSALSFALLASFANVLTAVLALVGNLFYVVVYTGWLKRSTDQNIVIGGAAGAVPPLVGYAAATGSVGVPALALFGIVFLWTPPHFWALALMIKEHYANARVPMLPVSRGEGETRRQIVLYSLVLVAFTVAAGLVLGPVYTAAAALLGGWFLALAWRLRRDGSRGNAAALFHYSLAYLALLFAAAAIDPLLV